MILRYSNRLEFRNAGASLKPDDSLGEPGSVLRNKRIAEVLHETPYAEMKGSGIRVIRDTMMEAGLAPPFFESNPHGDLFVATFLFHHFLEPEDIAWLANFKDLHLSDEDAPRLIFLREAGALNNAAYRMLNRVDTLTASDRLRNLRDANLLEQKGKSSATYYVPGPRFRASPHPAQRTGLPAQMAGLPTEQRASLPPELPSLPPELPSLPPKLTPLPPKLTPLPPKLTPLPMEPTPLPMEPTPLPMEPTPLPMEQPLLGESIQEMRKEMPAVLRQQLNALGQRTAPTVLDAFVERLCRWRTLTLAQLGELIARDPNHVRKTVLRRLLGSGRIRYRYPDEPRHPDQAYWAPTPSDH